MTDIFTVEQIDDNERISRFITNKKYFNKNTNYISASAFSPSKKTNNCSAYRTKGLDEPEIWDIALKFVTEKRDDKAEVLARADIQANVYKGLGLSLNPDGIPHPRHVNILGWASEESRYLMIRTELSNKAILVVKP